MGIKQLNPLLRQRCSPAAIHATPLEKFRGRTLAVDAYIYLYKFQEHGEFRENVELMLSALLEHGISPIFVFDGKPPAEKRDLIEQRLKAKRSSELKYNDALAKVAGKAKPAARDSLEKLRMSFLRVSREHISVAKVVMAARGVATVDAPGEADGLCARMVSSGEAWACLSDDMDLLVYGCRRVIRDLDVARGTAVIYDMKAILRDMNMTMKLFREVMVISGTDYNVDSATDLCTTMRWLAEYLSRDRVMYGDASFYDWLEAHTSYISDRRRLDGVYRMFDPVYNL